VIRRRGRLVGLPLGTYGVRRDQSGGRERRHRAVPRRLGQPAPHQVVVGPGVVEAHGFRRLLPRPQLGPRQLGQDRQSEAHKMTVRRGRRLTCRVGVPRMGGASFRQ
jgi:hypothetical protein